MSRFIESICITDRQIRNLTGHQLRFSQTQKHWFGVTASPDLGAFIQNAGPPAHGKYKCRIVYDDKIQSVEFIPYTIRTPRSFAAISHHEIDYFYKSEDRAVFDQLKNTTDKEEIIIIKNGQVTDTSYSNLIFYDGKNWITPHSCLLNGVMRQALLNTNKIRERSISLADLNRFSSFKLINAMMSPEESPALDIRTIAF